jgi:potassium/hydrogen antiporter
METTHRLSGLVAESVLIGILFGLVAGILWVVVLISMHKVKNTMFASLAFILILFGTSELIGFNGGFAVLTFGIMSGNLDQKPFNKWFSQKMAEKAREYSSNEQHFFDEISFLIQTYFFVYMGMQLENYSLLVFLICLIVVVGLVFLRWVSVKAFTSKQIDYKERLIMSILLPKGIIPAVMVTFAYETGLAMGLEIMQYGYAVIIISLFVSSVLILIAQKDPMYFNRMLKHHKILEDGNTDTNS